ncbi:MAG: YidC/Oxa1 family membrane protein insertase [Bacilli bacterium]|nr:YidC/Oxa1 family membrane protein insertase [Bacilli bacterium]
MKRNKVLSIILVLVLLLTTGCGSDNYIKDAKGKVVINETTGQNLQKDIYCKPSKDTEAYKLYEKYEDQLEVKLNKLPECEDFKVNSVKNNSLWQFLFVKPLAYLILKLGYLLESIGFTKSYLGISVMIIGIIIRFIILPFNIKTQKQSKKLQELAPELQRIERKYANKTDNESIMMKSQETMALYSKYKVNPLSSCLISLVQLPLFFAFLQAIYKIPAIYEGEIFGWNLGTTPSVGIFTNHQYSFLILIVLIVLTTYFSFKYTMRQNKNSAMPGAESQMKTMLIVMTVMIGIASVSLPTAIALYWIVTYAFIIIQTYVMNLITKKKDAKKVNSKSKKIKEKLKVKEGMKYGKNK